MLTVAQSRNKTKQLDSMLTGSPLGAIDATLQLIFNSNTEDVRLHKARAIMSDSIDNLSDKDLGIALTEFQALIEYWLDEFEREVFNGSTLTELLREG
jgi:hypothetical protein